MRIEELAFADCPALQTVVFPNTLRAIHNKAFMNCTALQTVNLPKSIERLQKDAFKGCTGLSKIICPKKYPPIIDDAFDSYEITVYVPEGLRNKYFSDKFWKPFKDVKELK